VGKNTHEFYLREFFELLEIILTKSRSNVNLRCENIDALWQMFVQKPNFDYDQDYFVRWVNKSRDKGYQEETFIFSEEERLYFFQKILCNPTYVDFRKMSFGQFRCFQKYFKVINQQNQALRQSHSTFKVVNFKELLGVGHLWDITIQSEVDRTRDEAIDFLVDVHIRQDPRVPPEEAKEIQQGFLEKCFQVLEDPDMITCYHTPIQLIIKLLDKFEGKKPIKPELKISMHY